jgi:hypothetical protein
MNELKKDKITSGWYLKGLIKGLVLWIPFTIMALVVPFIGWLMLPMVPFFPFVWPFIEREYKYKKLLKQAREKLLLKEYEKAVAK